MTPPTDPNRVLVFDTTLRDGEQSPGCSMNLAEKLEMALQLKNLGVDVIEAPFDRIGTRLLDAYLAIKRKGAIG